MFPDLKEKIQILKNTIGALCLDHRDARYLVMQIESIEAEIKRLYAKTVTTIELPYTFVPIEEMSKVVCDYCGCAAGMGLGGSGSCFRKGDPFDKDCKQFISDEDFEKEIMKDE